MLKDYGVESRNVDNGKHGNETSNNSPEKEGVPPNIVHPLGEVLLALWLHSEEGSSHIDHLPSKEQGEPCQAGKSSGTSTENNLALFAVGTVAIVSNVGGTVAETVEDKDERAETESRHPKTVDNHVDHQLGSKDTLFQLLHVSKKFQQSMATMYVRFEEDAA